MVEFIRGLLNHLTNRSSKDKVVVPEVAPQVEKTPPEYGWTRRGDIGLPYPHYGGLDNYEKPTRVGEGRMRGDIEFYIDPETRELVSFQPSAYALRDQPTHNAIERVKDTDYEFPNILPDETIPFEEYAVKKIEFLAEILQRASEEILAELRSNKFFTDGLIRLYYGQGHSLRFGNYIYYGHNIALCVDPKTLRVKAVYVRVNHINQAHYFELDETEQNVRRIYSLSNGRLYPRMHLKVDQESEEEQAKYTIAKP
jgi:hypothetical protein